MIRQSSGWITMVVLLILVAAAGCSAPDNKDGLPVTSPAGTGTPAAGTATPPATPTPVPAMPSLTTVTSPGATINATPVPLSTTLPETAINARIVDARNKLGNMIETDVADTVIVRTDRMQGCEVKKSREIAYLIDCSTGESTFIKGDYWHIEADLFTDLMKKDREYIIVHTHPKVWETCAGSGTISLNTFSIGDLAATANITRRGYHIKQLMVIADRDYRTWPGEKDGWKTGDEIVNAIIKIESGSGRGFLSYNPVEQTVVVEMDNLMPFLAKELGYHYTINNNVIS